MTYTTRTAVAALLAVLVVSTAAAPVAAGSMAADSEGETYAGTHVSFEATGEAVTNYTVGDAELLASVETESRDEYRNRAGVGAGVDVQLTSVTNVQAAGVSVAAKSQTNATVATESGAEMEAHDNERGILQVRAEEESQIVKADVAADGEATAESEDRAVVTTESGSTGTFIVVGDGSVSVNNDGDVVADLDQGSQLVFRSYTDGSAQDSDNSTDDGSDESTDDGSDDSADGDSRDQSDREVEKMIAEGKATAEVYVMERGGEQVTDTVTYGSNTSVEARQSAENEVNVTVERAASEGKVVVTQVQESAVGSTENLDVRVDGEAAAKASSYSALKAATENGDTSKYMVEQSGSAEGSAQVLVGVNHFSERTITMSGDDGSSTDDGSDGDDSSGDDDSGGSDPGSVDTPGFGVMGAAVAMAVVALLVRRRL